MILRYILLLFVAVSLFIFRLNQVGGIPNRPVLSSNLVEEGSRLDFSFFRQRLDSQIKRLLTQPQAPLLSGIILGVKSDLPEGLKNGLVNTSTIHIAVVSGQNLSLLAGFLMGFSPFIGRKKLLILTLISCLIYCLITGLQIPVIRALIMVTLGYIAQFFGRQKDSFWILVITGAVMLIYQPLWLFSISFQLSFLATVGVIVVAPVFLKALESWPNILKEDLAVSLAAQLLTIPVIAINFHQLSIVGLLVNALVLWTISLIMISGTLSILISFLSFGLGWLIGLFPYALLSYFIYIVQFFSQLPASSIYLPKIPLLFWFGYYLIVAGFFFLLKKQQRRALSAVSLTVTTT